MTKEEVLKSKIKSIYILENDGIRPIVNTPDVSVVDKKIFTEHFEKYEFFNTENPNKMGQYFLYEKLLDGKYQSNAPHDHELFYPKLGVYLNSLPCDQTIEVEWVDYRRTWEWNTEYDYEYKDKDGLVKPFQNYIGELPTEIERLPIWSDYLLVYGVWNSMPNWQQLRQAYERTWWFHRTTDELRDLQLNRLLK
jgi:hypothetical protein